MSIYDEIYSRFHDFPDEIVQERVSRSLMARLDLGWHGLHDADVDAIADLVVARRVRSLVADDDVARALLVKAEIRIEASQFTVALRLLNAAIATGSCANVVARARLRRAAALAGLERLDEALAQLSDLTENVADDDTLLETSTLQASLLEITERADEAIASLDRTSHRLGGVLALRAMRAKAQIAERLGRIDCAASEYQRIAERTNGTPAYSEYASQARRALRRLTQRITTDPGGDHE
jgi:tetratricopeptide (TPR) repeat protein